MKKLLIVVVALACLMYLVAAQDVESIKKQIIAQYEKLGGPSIYHREEVADVIDPAHLHITL